MSRIRIPGKLPYLKFPVHYKGAPQRRLFFPDWYIKLIKPKEKYPPNFVKFHVPADMTKYDVKEYLEKIYSVAVATIQVTPVTWFRHRDDSGKWCFVEPFKVAHVRLGEGQTFEFPELIAKEKEDEQYNQVETYEQGQNALKEYKDSKEEKSDSRMKAQLDNKWFA